MTFEQLIYFVETYQLQSITKAADKLYCSRPTVSLAIKSLEDEFNIPLFYRFSNYIKPTPAGITFYQEAKKILHDADNLKQQMKYYSHQHTDYVTFQIGLGETLFLYYADEFTDALCTAFPSHKFNFSPLYIPLQENFYCDYDLVLVAIKHSATPALLNTLTPEYSAKHLGQFSMFAWIAKTSPLCQYQRLTLAQLMDYTEINFKQPFGLKTNIHASASANSHTTHLKRDFIDKLQSEKYYALDMPIDHGKLIYKELLEDSDIISKPLDLVFSIECIYKTEFCQPFLPAFLSLQR